MTTYCYQQCQVEKDMLTLNELTSGDSSLEANAMF